MLIFQDLVTYNVCQSFLIILFLIKIFEPPIDMEPWYFGDMPRDSAVRLLKRNGDYLVRYSSNAKGYVLTFQWEGKAINSQIEKLITKVLY